MWNQKEKSPTFGNSWESGGGSWGKRERRRKVPAVGSERSEVSGVAEKTVCPSDVRRAAELIRPHRNKREVSEGAGVSRTRWGTLSQRQKTRVSVTTDNTQTTSLSQDSSCTNV